MGPGRVLGGYRYSPPSTHPPSHYPGYTLPPGPGMLRAVHGAVRLSKCVVGLRSVAQLTLSALFSGFRTITEVYNLAVAGIFNNHYSIPGNK